MATLYDNECAYATSVSLRLPWLLAKNADAVDAFHYGKGHSCGPSHDPSSHDSTKGHNGSAAESLNARFAESHKTARYLGAYCLVPFFALRLVYINLIQKAKLATGYSHVGSLHLAQLGSQLMPCMCPRCLTGRIRQDHIFMKAEKIVRGESGAMSVWNRASSSQASTSGIQARTVSLAGLSSTARRYQKATSISSRIEAHSAARGSRIVPSTGGRRVHSRRETDPESLVGWVVRPKASTALARSEPLESTHPLSRPGPPQSPPDQRLALVRTQPPADSSEAPMYTKTDRGALSERLANSDKHTHAETDPGTQSLSVAADFPPLLTTDDSPGPDRMYQFVYWNFPDGEEIDFDARDGLAIAESEGPIYTVENESSAFSLLTAGALATVRRRLSATSPEDLSVVLSMIRNVPISGQDMLRLKPPSGRSGGTKESANDEIVNGYMALVQDRSDRLSSLPVRAMSSFFIVHWSKKGYMTAREWRGTLER